MAMVIFMLVMVADDIYDKWYHHKPDDADEDDDEDDDDDDDDDDDAAPRGDAIDHDDDAVVDIAAIDIDVIGIDIDEILMIDIMLIIILFMMICLRMTIVSHGLWCDKTHTHGTSAQCHSSSTTAQWHLAVHSHSLGMFAKFEGEIWNTLNFESLKSSSLTNWEMHIISMLHSDYMWVMINL